jgi:hypothetical protein
MDGKIMEMNPKNFEEQATTKKGRIGEEIIRKHLQDKGWMTYSPDALGAHYFDMIAMKNKEKIIALDVKTKARLNFWTAQGIDKRHYDQYMNFVKQTKIPFYLVFIDDKNGDIHVAEITKLKDPIFPRKDIIAWPLEQMAYLGQLGDEQIKDLSQYDTRRHSYDPR